MLKLKRTLLITIGVLAHLVERFHGMEEVRSSNLLHSTTFTRFARRGVFCAIMQGLVGCRLKVGD